MLTQNRVSTMIKYYKSYAYSKYYQSSNPKENNQTNKIRIILIPNAVIKPFSMVVEIKNSAVTLSSML